MIYDFHSHVLFGIDDGAKDEPTSVQMLKKSAEQGVDTVLLTSHCYPMNSEDINRYIKRRDDIYRKLCEIPEIPKLIRGCEVHLTQALTSFPDIHKLCIEGTDYMLLEMPNSLWTDRTIDNVYKLNLIGITPVIAHDERNMNQKAEFRNALYDLDVLIQINAPSLFMVSYTKEIDKMMKRGLVHVIGTDMHNLKSRKPCMDKAKKKIERRYGVECWNYLMDNAEKILKGEEIPYYDFKSFKKKGLL